MGPEYKLLILTFLVCSTSISYKLYSESQEKQKQKLENPLPFDQEDFMVKINNFLVDDDILIPLLLQKVKNFVQDNGFEKIESLVDRGITVLSGKTQFACWGPAIKQCEKENPGQICEKATLSVRPKCKEGYTRILGNCVPSCPDGFRDDGLFCLKPSPYGRGIGYAIWNEEKCNKENEETGCEKYGLMYYPKCKESYHYFGCCVCSPDCPEGYTDIGISCQKPIQEGNNMFNKSYPVHVGSECLDQENQIIDGEKLNCEKNQGITGHFKQLLVQYLDKFFVQNQKELGDSFEDVYEMIKEKIIKYEEC